MRRINRDLRRSPFLDAALIKKSEYGFSAKVVISIRVRTKTALVLTRAVLILKYWIQRIQFHCHFEWSYKAFKTVF